MTRPRRRFGPVVPVQWMLVVSHVLTLALPLGALFVTGAWSRDLLHQRQEELSRQAALVAMMVEAEWRAAHALPGDHPEMPVEGEELGPPGGEHAVSLPDRGAPTASTAPDPDLARIGPAMTSTFVRVFHATHAGVRLIDANGEVIATSGPRLGESLADRPEVQAALAGRSDVAARTEQPPPLIEPRADERKQEPLTWAYATLPLAPEGRVIGAILLTRPTRGVGDALEDMHRDLYRGGFVALVATVALALGFGWRISRSLRALSGLAHGLAEDASRPGARAHLSAEDPRRDVLDALRQTRVAEVRALADAFARMEDEIQARLRYNQEYAGNVSHEFKTPLATLRGTVDLLVEDAEMPAEQRARFLANARTDLDRLDRMVSGLLELARAEAGTAREEFGLDEVVEAVAARHPGVTVTGTAGRVEADFGQVELALGNLVENAFHHGAPPVRLVAWREGDRTGVDVFDAGPGISEGNLARVFERFFTTSAERRGTGLGLALVRAVARAHDGDVEVQSRAGETRFRLWLPLA